MTGEAKVKGLANMVPATWDDTDTMPADYGRTMARLIVAWCEARERRDAAWGVVNGLVNDERMRAFKAANRALWAAEAALAEAVEGQP